MGLRLFINNLKTIQVSLDTRVHYDYKPFLKKVLCSHMQKKDRMTLDHARAKIV